MGDGVGVGVGVAVGATDGLGVGVGVAVGATDGLGVGVGAGSEPVPGRGVGVGVWLPAGTALGECAGEEVGNAVRPAVATLAAGLNGCHVTLCMKGTQVRPLPANGSQTGARPVSPIRVTGPRPRTKKVAMSASASATAPEATRLRVMRAGKRAPRREPRPEPGVLNSLPLSRERAVSGFLAHSFPSEARAGMMGGTPEVDEPQEAVRMTEEQQMVREFHERFGAVASDRPTWCGGDVHRHRVALIEEELAEFRNAGEAQDLVEIADALADLLYVVYGAGVTYGIDLEPIFREIHRSNMSKGEPEVRRRPDGTIFKGDHYRPPDVRSLLVSQAAPSQVAATA